MSAVAIPAFRRPRDKFRAPSADVHDQGAAPGLGVAGHPFPCPAGLLARRNDLDRNPFACRSGEKGVPVRCLAKSRRSACPVSCHSERIHLPPELAEGRDRIPEFLFPDLTVLPQAFAETGDPPPPENGAQPARSEERRVG